jgi:hypothetical protein
VIPAPYGFLDELHRHPDMRLWNLWGGKLRKRKAQLVGISTGGEPDTPFEDMRDKIRRRAKVKEYDGAYLRAEGKGEVLHEWMVLKDEDCSEHGGGQGSQSARGDHGRDADGGFRARRRPRRLEAPEVQPPDPLAQVRDHRQGMG